MRGPGSPCPAEDMPSALTCPSTPRSVSFRPKTCLPSLRSWTENREAELHLCIHNTLSEDFYYLVQTKSKRAAFKFRTEPLANAVSESFCLRLVLAGRVCWAPVPTRLISYSVQGIACVGGKDRSRGVQCTRTAPELRNVSEQRAWGRWGRLPGGDQPR